MSADTSNGRSVHKYALKEPTGAIGCQLFNIKGLYVRIIDSLEERTDEFCILQKPVETASLLLAYKKINHLPGPDVRPDPSLYFLPR